MGERLTLMDLRRKSEVVDLGDGAEVEVTGVTVKQVADLLARFESLQKWASQAPITAKEFVKEVPDAVAAVIASATGYHGDLAAEEHVSVLTLEQQYDLLAAISRVTFTRGFASFMVQLRVAAEAVSAETGKAPDTKSQNSLSPAVIAAVAKRQARGTALPVS